MTQKVTIIITGHDLEYANFGTVEIECSIRFIPGTKLNWYMNDFDTAKVWMWHGTERPQNYGRPGYKQCTPESEIVELLSEFIGWDMTEHDCKAVFHIVSHLIYDDSIAVNKFDYQVKF